MLQYREDKGNWFLNLFSRWSSKGFHDNHFYSPGRKDTRDQQYWLDKGMLFRSDQGEYYTYAHYEKAKVFWYRRVR